MKIQIVDYLLFDYEVDFLVKELKYFGAKWNEEIKRNAILNVEGISMENALSLTYVKGIYIDDMFVATRQHEREINDCKKRTQAKRFGPHYLHEYKGRFNPQMPRSLLLRNFNSNSLILDPFMGSGTTLIEARDLGIKSYGIELNPMAHMITKAKQYYEEIEQIEKIKIFPKGNQVQFSLEVEKYLLNWFPKEQFEDLKKILFSIHKLNDKKSKTIYSIILSNLLREHSLQDPRDLRIRRRTEVPNNIDLFKSFLIEVDKLKSKHANWIDKFGITKTPMKPILGDSRSMLSALDNQKVSGSISSPPYASALPYVDTYRLSMVALGLIKPADIQLTEKNLIGSRDINKNDEISFEQKMTVLPKTVKDIISFIKKSIENEPKSGFRKKAVPYFLSNYASSMLLVLEELYNVEENSAKNYWVLGPNKVKIHEDWFFIDTPNIVGELAKQAGFKDVSVESVQAYPRYNIHSKNSIDKESILIFKK